MKLSSYFCAKALLAASLIVTLATSVSAATLVLTTDMPVPGTYDVYSFAGADNDTVNVQGGADQNTYVAPDRPTQGQTFTTPASSSGFLISDIWIRHCGYTNTAPGNGTWWNLGSGAVYTIRVTDPSKLGQSGFALSTETYTATGTENSGSRWTGGNNSLGDDVWLHFTLATPIHLSGGMQYGMDITATAAGGGNYFEWLGTSNSVAGGQAYTGSVSGTPGNAETMDGGSRVFLVQLTQTVPRVAPAFTSASRFASVGQPVQITVSIPPVVNQSQSVTLSLASDNAAIGAFSAAGLATTNLTFAAGATNVQTFTAYVRGTGTANLSVVTNSVFLDASIQIGSSITAHEAFDYDPTVQTTLDGANGGSGFGGAWSDSAGAATIVTGLTYGNDPYVAVSSNAVTVTSSGQAFRTLPGTYGGVGGGTIWVSFLVQGGGLNNWGGVSFFTGTGTEHLFMGEVPGISPNNTWGFLEGGSTYMNFPNSITPGSQTDFLVYRIDFPATNGGKALVTFYADPPLSATTPYTATGSGAVDNFSFDTLRLGTGGSVTWGEIRIGTDWTNMVQIVGTPQLPGLPTPSLSAPANFLPIGQTTAVTVTIPTNTVRPLSMVITNSNPASFSISSTNAAATTLTFGVGATNVQILNVQVLASGAATLTVVSNTAVNGTSLNLASQVSASEEFQYLATSDGGLAGADGGLGFTDLMTDNPWAGGGGVSSPGLSYSGLVTSSNCATVIGSTAGGAGNGTRTLILSSGNYGGVGGGTVWISFLVQGAFPASSSSDYAGVALLNGSGTSFFMGLDTTQPNNGKWGYTGTGAGETGFAGSVAPSTNTDLLVYRLDFPSTVGDLVTVTFYADPPAAATPPETPTGIGASYSFNFNGIQIGTDFNMNFDEIRVGGSWADVVPTQPVIILNAVKLTGNQVRLSWPTSLAGTYTVLTSATLAGPWVDSGLTITTSGGNYIATDTITSGAKFYRLQKQ